MSHAPSSLIDKLYRFAIARNRIVRVAAGFASRAGLSFLALIRGFHPSSDRSLTDWHMLLGSYERGTVTFLHRWIRPGMVVVDVGAHIGFFTRHLSRLVGPSGRVISFEAHPATYELLKRNCRKLDNVDAVNAAATNFEGKATLFDSGGSTGSNSLVSSRSVFQGSNEVRAVRLDHYVADQAVDLVKIDVEGGELEVLDGMKGILDVSPSIAVVIEFFPPVWSKHPEGPRVLLDRLEDMGFRVALIEDDGSLSEVDGWPSFEALVHSVQKYVNLVARRSLQPRAGAGTG